ncbi:unnamed protein product [Arctogadus glacialis]
MILTRALDFEFTLEIRVVVIVENVNDEGPTFSQNSYDLIVVEFTPVNRVVGTYDANDKDSTSLYYKLEPDVGFGLESLNNGRIVVKSPLDYDVIKSVKLTLYAQDTAESAPEGAPSFTASTTIMVTITDDDNRPPWFQPCDVISVGPSKICQTYGYTGSVSLTEQQAAQTVNSFQFATTTVTIQVVTKSLHEPVFEGAPYSGVVSGLGSMVFKSTDNTPLIIQATDEDFLGVEARDTAVGDVITADVQVEVTSGGAGRYGASDMAALGATLAVLLFISLGIIGYLVYRVQHGKAAWGKLSEASVFRSSLGRGPGGPNDGVQYTNEAFKKDEDSDSTGQASPAELRRKLSAETASTMARNTAATEETVMRSAATLLAMLPEEEGSTSEMDGVDGEKEVKPILTKERRTEEGYKSVWFKQDIVPDAKEDVHIIPDNTEHDAEEDDEASTSSGNEEDSTPGRKVMFGDMNLDSGLEVKASDSGSDSENNEIVTSDL